MSQDQPILLYVGNSDTGQWLASVVEQGYVYTPAALLETLGIFVTYMPDLVILDAMAAPDLSEQVYFHLQTVGAESILVVDNSAERWESQPGIHILTSDSRTDLLAAISNLTGISFTVGEGA